MNETSKSKLELNLDAKLDAYTNSTNEDEKIRLLKEINSLRKILEEIEKHEQEIKLKEARSQAEQKRIAYEQEKDAREEKIEKDKYELERKKEEREAKSDKREFWLRLLGIGVPFVGGLIQLGVSYAQYCGIVNMIYKESERPTPELKDAMKFTKDAIFRSK